MLNLKIFGRKRSYSNRGVIRVFIWRNSRRPRSTSFRTASVEAEVRSQVPFEYTSQMLVLQQSVRL
jgi:hypothetical protein